VPTPRELAAAFRPVDRYQDSQSGRFRAVTFALGEERLAAGTTDGRVLLFDLTSEPWVLPVQADSFGVQALVPSADGVELLAAGRDGVAMLDALSGRKSVPEPAWPGERSSVACSAEGVVAAGGQDGSVHLRAPTGEELPQPPPHTSPISALAFTPDGKLLLVGSHEETSLWEIASGQELWRKPFPTQTAAFTPDGEQVVVGNERGELRLLRVEGPEEVRSFKRDEDGVWTVALSPDGALVASGTESGALTLWSLEEGEPLGRLEGHQDAVLSVAFDAQRQLLVSGGRDGQVILWATEEVEGPVLPSAEEEEGQGVELSEEFEEELDDEVDEGELVHMLVGHESDITAVAVSPAGDLCATADASGVCRVWDAVTGEELALLQSHEGAVTALAFNGAGVRLASGGQDGAVWAWDSHAGGEVLEGRGHMGPVTALAWHPVEEDTLLSGSRDGTVRLWDVAQGKAAGSLQGAFRQVTALAVSPDGKLLAVGDEAEGGAEPAVKLWDVEGKKLLGSLSGHEGSITSLAFSPDQTCVLSGSADGTARLWGVEKQECVVALQGDAYGAVHAVSFSPNGRVLQIAGTTTVRLYDAVEGEVLYESDEHGGEHAALLYTAEDALVIASALGAIGRVQTLPVGSPEEEGEDMHFEEEEDRGEEGGGEEGGDEEERG
jgi:WD40 repeat protein